MNTKRWPRMGFVTMAVLCVVLSGSSRAAEKAGSPSQSAAIEAGKRALRAGDLASAREQFKSALEDARRANDTGLQAESFFYLGLMDAQSAIVAPTNSTAPALLESARSSYESALSLRPESPGILNNLSQVLIRLGRTNDAAAALARAIAIPDPMRAFYAQNYADVLLSMGRWQDACRFYSVVAGEQPQNRPVHQKLVELCIARDPDQLGWYLWELAKGGQVIQVQNHALDIVTHPAFSRAQREELMAMVAYCLSRQTMTRDEFLSSPVAQRLAVLEKDEVVGEGARELTLLYKGERLQPRDYRWWPRLVDTEHEAPRGMWPLEAFQGLMRALAESAARKEPKLQEAYLMLAVGIHPRAPDPDALTALANFYSSNNQLAKLDNVMKRYQDSIFEAKGAAYTASQLEKIYRYHMALGVIYSHLNRWTTPGRIDSAEFQLNRALMTADEITQNKADTGASVNVPPRLVELLADGYEKTGRPSEAFRVRVSRAEKYLQADDRESATRLLTPAKKALEGPSALNDADKATLLRVDQALARPAAATTLDPSRTRISVGPSVRNVTGAKGSQAISETERKTIATTLDGIVGQLSSGGDRGAQSVNRGAASRTRYQPLPTNNLPAGVQEVTVSGRQGRMLLKRGTNLVEVPFKVDAAAGAKSSEKLRWVRP